MKTREEVLADKRAWYRNNTESARRSAKKSRLKHKEKRSAACKDYYLKHRDALLEYAREYNKKWYARNKVRRSEQIKAYSKAHRADNVRRTQKYIQNNKQKFLDYRHSYNRTTGAGYLSYKNHAKKRDREFTITLGEFSELILKPCHYCGEDKKRIGVDRIDNTKGYTLDNCAPCCKLCNYMKRDHSLDDFLDHIRKIYTYNGK